MKNAWIIVLIAVVSACVPAKKYEDLKTLHEKMALENADLRQKSQSLESQLKELQTEVERLRQSENILQGDTTRMGRVLRRLQSQYDKINELNDELLSKYASLQKGSQAENQKILKELEGVKSELQRREDELDQLERELNAKESELGKISTELEKREERVNELERLIAEKDQRLMGLQKRIEDALLGFRDKGLSVVQKNGKLYVSMEAKLLFPSGSYVVDSQGREALVELGKVLQGKDDIEILVEGHTDTDQIASSRIPRNNWELSVLRATSVVQILLENSQIRPQNVIAAGRSEYLPVDPADKSKNRRIEVILSPRLDKLFELINSPEETEADTLGH